LQNLIFGTHKVQRAAQDIAEGAGRLPDQETEDKQRQDPDDERDGKQEPVFLEKGDRQERDRDGRKTTMSGVGQMPETTSNRTRGPTLVWSFPAACATATERGNAINPGHWLGIPKL
jgi:hypothetical protein